MKLTNWFVEKFGTDKMLHFMGGALMVAVPSPFGWWGVLVGFIMMLGLSFIKEQCLDSTFDKKGSNLYVLSSITFQNSSLTHKTLFITRDRL